MRPWRPSSTPFYAKLGYSEFETADFLSKVRGLGPAVGGPEPTVQGKAPPLTLENIAWILSPDSRKKRIGNKHCHGFWGKMECGLSSVSPWEYVPKEAGIKRAGGKL